MRASITSILGYQSDCKNNNNNNNNNNNKKNNKNNNNKNCQSIQEKLLIYES